MRRLTPLVAGACLLLGGCAGDLGSREPDEDFTTYSAADVKKRFKEVTGAELNSSQVISPVSESLRVEARDEARGNYDRFGTVTVEITKNEEALENATDGRFGQARAFDNVVVRVNSRDERSRQAFRRMVAVMSSLGKPASAAKLPAADRPCAKAGIDPEGGDGREGSCVAPDGKSIEVVNADGTLVLPNQTLSGLRVATGRKLTESGFGAARRRVSQGRFVVVGFEVENTGDQPLTSIRPGLVVDGKQYSDDVRGSVRVRPTDALPIQPGGRARTRAVFEVPGAAGQDVLSEGALEVAAGDYGYASVESSVRTGRIRLQDAPPLAKRFGDVRLSD